MDLDVLLVLAHVQFYKFVGNNISLFSKFVIIN